MNYYFHDSGALLERLSKALKRRDQQVIFLVGAPLSAPSEQGQPGVPGVEGMINLIRREFEDDSDQIAKLNEAIDRPGSSKYQEAFLFLQGRRGQQTANEIVRNAVLQSRTASAPPLSTDRNLDDTCRTLEKDNLGWALSRGTEALGKLIAGYPDRFGRSLLTTNFDPLLEVAIRRAGGVLFRTTLHADGNLSQTEGTGCHVIHLHGYWFGSDTLHTPYQLTQPRPRLRASLSAMLRNKLVVVCAYGGWQDTFTETLVELIRDDTAYPEILWTFYSAKPEADARLERLAPGIDRGNISLYAGIDCHELFPRLYESWVSIVAPHPTHLTDDGPMVRVPAGIAEQIRQKPARTTVLEGDDEDRPPLIDICVGRDDEFRSIQESSARVVFVTGLGGQGKSTLVAKYYLACQDPPAKYSYLVWRDCKEESERFELQLASVIETISNGQISGTDLARQDAETIIALLLKHTQGLSILFVFDNADHYVDIEKRRMLGSADTFVNALLKESSESRVIFTCRPTVEYDVDLALSIPLGGIDLFSARRLFEERKAVVGNSEIETAHRLTGGHAFWLDLLAVQVTKGNLGREFALLLDDIGEGGGPLPEPTLHSIWSTLKPREQAVLRSMAESVRPASEALIADYVSGELTFHKASKAIRALRSLNLVVVKTKVKGPDLFELHPLVRAFIRRRFPMRERASYIGGIIKVYKRLIGQHRGELEKRPRLSVLQYWTQSAELAIALGSFDEAFDTLNEVDSAFAHSGYPRELARVSRLLFSSLDWVVEHSKYKHFEVLFKSFVRTLAHLGEIGAVDELLDKYERSVPDRGVRYIRYCELRSYAFWFRSDFKAALVWGRAGQKLVDQSNVDSTISWPIRHTLALAERDAGLPEVALPIFLDGRQLAEVIDSKELSDDRGEHHYGNIGRCLQFMEQDDSALICYQKSALLIERAVRGETLLNKAYARTWIGEVLMGRDRLDLAYAFLRSAQRLWDQVAPPKAPAVNLLVKEAERRAGRAFRMRVPEIEKTCLDWILGQTRNIS